MAEKTYHHGNLRNALIETGIEILSTKGLENFSLRKVALACGVSPSASYSHFKDIEELRTAMGKHVSDKFIEILTDSIKGVDSPHEKLRQLGYAYIEFFEQNPNYFQFLFYFSGTKIDLESANNTYKPFNLFQQVTFEFFKSIDMPEEEFIANTVSIWANVHGIASLLTNKDVKYSGDWKKALKNIIFSKEGK